MGSSFVGSSSKSEILYMRYSNLEFLIFCIGAWDNIENVQFMYKQTICEFFYDMGKRLNLLQYISTLNLY